MEKFNRNDLKVDSSCGTNPVIRRYQTTATHDTLSFRATLRGYFSIPWSQLMTLSAENSDSRAPSPKQIEEELLERLQEVRRRHFEGDCDRDEFAQALKRFADLILRGTIPKEISRSAGA
jgi:hypothetical protein